MDPLLNHQPLPAHPPLPKPVGHGRRKVPRSFRDLTPGDHFNPRTFFREMVWHALKTAPVGSVKIPNFPHLKDDQLALTWIGHASFLVQFEGLNAIIDPNFANWLFLLKRLKRPGLRVKDLPPIDLVLLTHAHFDHFHKPTLRKIPSPKIAVMPWGCAPLAQRLGFGRIVELKWWESFGHDDWKVTLVPAEHWGARTLADKHRGWGGFVLEHRGRTVYHAGDSAYFPGSMRSASGSSLSWPCCPSEPTTRNPSARSTWGPTRHCRPSMISARSGWCPCTTARSSSRSNRSTNRPAGWNRSAGNTASNIASA